LKVVGAILPGFAQLALTQTWKERYHTHFKGIHQLHKTQNVSAAGWFTSYH